MKSKGHGILLQKINYSETSLILKLYTVEKGIQSYLFQGGKKKKGNILLPLSVVEYEYYQRQDSDLGKLTLIDPTFVFQEIPFDPVKSSMAFFIAEVLFKTLKSTDKEQELFSFLAGEIAFLDSTENYTNYLIWFSLELTKHLGFYPQQAAGDAKYFDLEEGEFLNYAPSGHIYVKDDSITLLNQLLNFEKDEFLIQKFSSEYRKAILQHLMSYYKYHIEGFKELKSLEIIEQVFY